MRENLHFLVRTKVQCLHHDSYMDFERAGRISQKHKDIVSGYIKQVQSLFPSENSFFNIIIPIQYIIFLYYYWMEYEFKNEELDLWNDMANILEYTRIRWLAIRTIIWDK